VILKGIQVNPKIEFIYLTSSSTDPPWALLINENTINSLFGVTLIINGKPPALPG
jgi:hypothetical protein